MMTNLSEHFRVVVYRIILIMATKLDTQHSMLLLKWLVPIEATPLPYGFHKATYPLAHGLLLNDPFSPTRFCPEISKTKKINSPITRRLHY
jgi:hypothetical protein